MDRKPEVTQMKIVRKLALVTLIFSMASSADTPESTWQLFTRSIGNLQREDIADASLFCGVLGGIFGAGLLTSNPFATRNQIITTGILSGLICGIGTGVIISITSNVCANK